MEEKLINYPKSKEYVDKLLVKNRYCKRCYKPILKSKLVGYPYQCMYCDEDLYEIETYTEEKKLDNLEYADLIEEVAAILCLD